MSFDLAEWKSQVEIELDNWVQHMREADVESIYAFLAASALWSIAKRARDGDYSAYVTLGDVAGSIGANWIVEQLDNWTSSISIAKYLEENLQNSTELRASLDRIIKRLELTRAAAKEVSPAELQWFSQALASEVKELGSTVSFQALILGDGASAQGEGAVAVGSGGVYVAGNLYMENSLDGHQEGAKLSNKPLIRYLENLYRKCQLLPLAMLSDNEGIENSLLLDQVYIELNTTSRVPTKELERLRAGETVLVHLSNDLDSAAGATPSDYLEMSLHDAAAFNPRLVILGDPGGGKSTFVKKLLGDQAKVLMGVSKPVLGFEKSLLPLIINLQELTASLRAVAVGTKAHEIREEVLAQAVRDHAMKLLSRYDAEDFSESLRAAFSSGRLILVFDGLDEVPEVLRNLVCRSMASVVNFYRPEHVIVTCRVRAYWGELVLPNFRTFTIARLDDPKISEFAHHWYEMQSQSEVSDDQVKSRSEDVISYVYASDLFDLASNPMFLTSILMLHQRNISLSNERVYIYHLLVDLLARRWQKQKGDERDFAPSDALRAFVDDEVRLRTAIELLAYESQRLEKGKHQIGGLSRGDALSLLENSDAVGNVTLASEFLTYVDQKAGLLIGSGGTVDHPSTYSFPHRTFQEYLAGCHIIARRDLDRTIFTLSKEEDHWSDAIELGMEELYFNRRNVYGLLDLGYRLCQLYNTSTDAKKPLIWSGKIAALIGRKTIEADQVMPDGGMPYLNNLVQKLVNLISGELSPHRRAQIGQILGILGDPREEVLETAKMVFCEVPGGEFRIGSNGSLSSLYEQPESMLYVPTYYILRHAITNAQYSEFINAPDGYLSDSHWTKAGLAWRKNRTRPSRYRRPYDLANHPIVGVTWFECNAFCNWLEKKVNSLSRIVVLRNGFSEVVSGKFKVRLPSELEWEKAAKGRDARLYSWGDEFSSDLCNAKETGIRSTVAVGVFPANASPCAALDMCGNTWEWCQNVWGWQYDEEFDAIFNDPSGDVKRVVRGGGYENNHALLRVSCRLGNAPSFALDDLGFRIVAYQI